MSKMKRIVETKNTTSTIIGLVETGTINITTNVCPLIDNIIVRIETNTTM